MNIGSYGQRILIDVIWILLNVEIYDVVMANPRVHNANSEAQRTINNRSFTYNRNNTDMVEKLAAKDSIIQQWRDLYYKTWTYLVFVEENKSLFSIAIQRLKNKIRKLKK